MEAIESRDLVKDQLIESQRISELKSEKISEASVKLQVLQNDIKEKESQQAKLITDCEKVKSERNFFNLKASRLERKLKEINQERQQLSKQKIKKEQLISQLESEKDSFQSDLSSQQKSFDRFKQKAQNLMKENEKIK